MAASRKLSIYFVKPKQGFPNFATWSWLADALRKRSSIEAKLLYGEAVKKLPQQRIPRKWKRAVTATDERD
jgi:hypothetical protein